MFTKITTAIDVELKTFFEATRKKHRLTYRDILEAGIREIIKDIDPQKLIEHDIQEAEFEQEERRQALSMIKIAPKQQKLPENDPDAELEKMRENLFMKDRESILRLWDRGGPNWENIIMRYQFRDKKEARGWLLSHIEIAKVS